MSKVYAVSTGSYSDYRIESIYSTRELAEEAISLSDTPNYYDIEEFDLDPPNAPAKDGWGMYTVVLHTSLTQDVDSKTTYHKASIGLGGHTPYYRDGDHSFSLRSEYTKTGARLIGYRFGCNVYADSDERAIKVANERRIVAVANGELRALEERYGIIPQGTQ